MSSPRSLSLSSRPRPRAEDNRRISSANIRRNTGGLRNFEHKGGSTLLIPPQIMESTKAFKSEPCHFGAPIAICSARIKSSGVFQPLASSSMTRIGLLLKAVSVGEALAQMAAFRSSVRGRA